MSIITSGIGKNPTMDSRAISKHFSASREVTLPKTENVSETKESTTQKSAVLSNVSGKELRYNVNEQLEQVIVKIVDPTTNKVIKEIPSTEIQQMRVRVKDAIGSFIDETR